MKRGFLFIFCGIFNLNSELNPAKDYLLFGNKPV